MAINTIEEIEQLLDAVLPYNETLKKVAFLPKRIEMAALEIFTEGESTFDSLDVNQVRALVHRLRDTGKVLP